MTQAGGKLDNKLVLKFHQLMQSWQARLVVMYGQTEATARIAYLDPSYLPEKVGAIGNAIPGGVLHLFDDAIEIQEANRVGELVYEGPNVSMGYATNRQDLAKEDELQGCLRTGDLAYRDVEGFYFITGRLKRISKVYGLRISLEEIEETLRHHGPVAVVGNDQVIALFFENQSGSAPGQYIQELAGSFQLHPSTFRSYHLEQLPLTSSGKIDYPWLERYANAGK